MVRLRTSIWNMKGTVCTLPTTTRPPVILSNSVTRRFRTMVWNEFVVAYQASVPKTAIARNTMTTRYFQSLREGGFALSSVIARYSLRLSLEDK